MEDINRNNFLEEVVSISVQEKDGDMWFAASNRNGIYHIDGDSHEIVEKILFEDEERTGYMLYHNMEISGNRLFFAPHRAKKISIYDIDRKEMYYLSLRPVMDRYKGTYNSGLKFGSIFKDGEYVYFLGYTYPAIIKVHRETLDVTYIDSWAEWVKGSNWGYFTVGNVKIGRKIILPLGCECGVLELDLDTDEVKLIKPDISFDGIGGIAKDSAGIIWMIGRGQTINKLIGWNMQENTYKEIPISMKEDDESCVAPFFEPICYKSKIFLFPIYAHWIYEADVLNERVTIHEILNSLIKREKGLAQLPMCTLAPRIVDEKISFITNGDRKWHEYHVESNYVDSFQIRDNENIEEYMQEFFNKSLGYEVLKEDYFDLASYIHFTSLMD